MTSPRVYRVSAIVLRQRELEETSRIVLLLTLERGKLSALAKGVGKTHSRLAGGLQLFSHVRLLLAAGRNLDLITQCQPISSFLPLRQNLAHFAIASHLVELTDRFVEPGARCPQIFELLLNTLQALSDVEDRRQETGQRTEDRGQRTGVVVRQSTEDRGERSAGADPDLLARGFELKLLGLLGYAPELTVCVSCGREKPQRKPSQSVSFSVSQGGIICGRCRPKFSGLTSLSEGAVEAMQGLARLSPQETEGLALEAKIRGELEGTLRAYLEYRLERGLKSATVLRALRRP